MKKKKVFLINTVILTATALLLRGIGLFFRVYLSNIIGAEGMGLYQLIFSVYMLASTFATSGISTAVTRLCADEMVCGNKKTVFRVLKRSVQLSVIVGAIINMAVYVFSNTIADIFIDDLRAAPSLRILSFSLVPMGISACFKGYFMARRKTITPSVASMIEQFVRIAVIVALFSMLKAKDIETACFYVLLADTIAETISCIFIFFSCIKDKKMLTTAEGEGNINGSVTSAILKIATPITAGRYLTSGLSTAENLIVPKCLSSYSGDTKSGLETFGLLKGMALPIIFFPSSFLQAISTLLIPEISESAALNEQNSIRRDVERVLGITIIGSTLVGGCFFLCSGQISVALYDSPQAGVLINVLAPLVPVMYLESVVDGILKGLNKQNSTLLYSTIDSGLRISLILLLVPSLGMDGFMLIMIFSNILTCSLNFIKLLKVTVLKFDIKNWFLKPLVSIVIAVCFAQQMCASVSNHIAYIIISITIISAVYFALILISGAVDIKSTFPYKNVSRMVD